MSQQATIELVDRWINEPAFKDEMRGDPEGTVRRHGFDLDEEELDTLRRIDWSLPDEALLARFSKMS